MPSAVARLSSTSNTPTPSKRKFRTIGFGALSRALNDTDLTSSNEPFLTNAAPTRASIDAHAPTTGTEPDIKHKAEHSVNVTNSSFFNLHSTPNPGPHTPTATHIDEKTTENMSNHMSQPSSTRPPVRMDNQDGPWSISVAENPHDAHSYSLYVKTPTHNLTLTRSAMEIVELHAKLSDSLPDADLPTLPIDAGALPIPAQKRKSTFLNTLSRLASPAGKSGKHSSANRRSQNSSTAPSSYVTPVVSPGQEAPDPFTAFSDGDTSADAIQSDASLGDLTSSNTSTVVAKYLTTLSNMPNIRQARVWKRFVRVRTDDLQSVRVERAIKRVRSDLAAHATPKASKEQADEDKENKPVSTLNEKETKTEAAATEPPAKPQGVDGIIDDSSVVDEAKVEEPTPVDEPASVEPAPSITEPESDAISAPSVNGTVESADQNVSKDGADSTADEATPSTPISSNASALRMHRSQSADPDKSSRLSRAYTNSSPAEDASSQTGSETSASTTTGRRQNRKKRSMSVDPNAKDGSLTSKKKSQRKVVVDDFEMMRVLGKGCAGKVLLVRHKTSSDLYAMKAITKRHVLAHQELQHTLTEQAVLKKMAAESKDPFVVKLWWSFHDKENLFLVLDFHPGGDLATQLARWGRLGRDRARFYAAEIVEGVEGLHAAGVIYRDLKPENILIGGDGHIVLTDFGLSKEFPKHHATATAPATPTGSRGNTEFYSSTPGSPQPTSPPWMKVDKNGEMASGWPGQPAGHTDSTSTFCGTAEYLAPEVIQGLPYSYEVDWWSFGTMLYEMLTGITPFWANNHSDMYVRVLQDELQFPDDRAIDPDTKSLIRGLLQRNPALRICEPRIKRHPYFSMIDWSHVYYKRYIPPYIPPIDPANASDTQNFDDAFLEMEPVLDDPNDMPTDSEQTDTERTDEESNTTPSQSRSSSAHPQDTTTEEVDDVFDGYSFKGRHSVLIDEEDEEEEEDSYGEEDSEEEEEVDLAELQGIGVEPPSELPNGELDEPKTPEARARVLPEVEAEVPEKPPVSAEPEAEPTPAEPKEVAEVAEEEASPPRKSKDLPPVVPEPAPKEKSTTAPANAKGPIPRPNNNRTARPRREKSGVPALDKHLPAAPDDYAEGMDKLDEEDDDWDFIEAVDGEDRNGTKGTSLFARGVVDRYRLAVFRKPTPSQSIGPRSVSGMSKASDSTVAESYAAGSPSPSQRRGRSALTFRKKTRPFLQTKASTPSTFSSKSSNASKTVAASDSGTLSASSTAPQTSSSAAPLTSMPPSLKSKESAISMGNDSFSSDTSGGGNNERNMMDSSTLPSVEQGKPAISSSDEPDKQKNKKLKKYKENAEKMLSIFSSPRHPTSQG